MLFSVALALFGSCIFHLLHYSSTREVRGRILHWQANESPVLRRYTFQVLLYLSRPLVWLRVTFCCRRRGRLEHHRVVWLDVLMSEIHGHHCFAVVFLLR